MKRIVSAIGAMVFVVSVGWAVPGQMTFQGTLKQNGMPVTETVSMQFAFTDANGNQIPDTTVITNNVTVTNGLFSVPLTIPTIDWSRYTPYIQIYVRGQKLEPPQPINANLYSVVAQNGLAPGMIALSTGSCPSGWTRFAALDGLFPRGGPSYGSSGGSPTHTHRLADSQFSIQGESGRSAGVATLGGPGTDGPLVAAAGGGSPAQQKLSTTDPASSLPPYVTIVFCQKN